jgi:hypothetical protein
MKTKTLIIASFLIASLHAQDKPADPYRPSKATAEMPAAEEPAAEKVVRLNISICYEAFSLPLAMAAGLQREQLADSALYAKMVAGLGDESVRQEIMQVIRAQSGQKATTESISEHLYATEYIPGKISNSQADTPEEPKADAKPGTEMAGVARLPALPTAFETRNVGNMIEVEPTLAVDEKSVELRVVPEQVALVGRTTQGQEFSTVEMPVIESNRLNTSATLRNNQQFLLGTNRRPPVSKVDPDSANRVWFAFVTATLAKP